MWALKGTLIGISIFAVGATLFMLLSLRSMSGGRQMSIDLRMMSSTTIYNPWFWAAFAASIVIGLAGLLSLILVLVFKLKEVTALPK